VDGACFDDAVNGRNRQVWCGFAVHHVGFSERVAESVLQAVCQHSTGKFCRARGALFLDAGKRDAVESAEARAPFAGTPLAFKARRISHFSPGSFSMSITGAMQAGISGLQAQSNAIGLISDNIANMNTVGYKRSDYQFASLVSQSSGSTDFSSGGVRAIAVPLIDQQGLLQSTSNSTDLAISGDGMFVVSPDQTASASTGTFFTRAGSFRINESGFLVNSAGYFLQGERLSQTQRDNILGGDSRQLSATSLGTLESTQVNLLTGSALPTTRVNLDANLPANDAVGDAHNVAITLFDQAGGSYSLDLTFTKTGAGAWSITNPAGGLRDSNGTAIANAVTIAPAAIAFNADSSLATATAFTVAIAGATPSGSAFSPSIDLDFGTSGDVDGITQFDADFNVAQNTQNGLAYGSFSTAEVSDAGVISAVFSNGQRIPIYILPFAQFTNPNGLAREAENVFTVTVEAGFQGLTQPKFGTAGKVAANSLEQSTVDLAQEFTNMIVAQRSYSANGKIITTADEMLNELVQLKR